MEDKWGVTIQPLTPLLRDEGLAFEEKVTEALKRGRACRRPREELMPRLRCSIFAQPVSLWSCCNRRSKETSAAMPTWDAADVVRVWRKGGDLHVYIADIKASRKERTEHRIQIAAYATRAADGGYRRHSDEGSARRRDAHPGGRIAAKAEPGGRL